MSVGGDSRFAVIGSVARRLDALLGLVPTRPQQPGQALAFFAHYREVGAEVMFWYVLAVNALQQMVFVGMFSYLAAHLMQTYHLLAGDTALPLALAGSGVIVGGFLGGRAADHPRRVAWFALSCLGGGLLAALVFVTYVSPWTTVALACGAGASFEFRRQ